MVVECGGFPWGYWVLWSFFIFARVKAFLALWFSGVRLGLVWYLSFLCGWLGVGDNLCAET